MSRLKKALILTALVAMLGVGTALSRGLLAAPVQIPDVALPYVEDGILYMQSPRSGAVRVQLTPATTSATILGTSPNDAELLLGVIPQGKRYGDGEVWLRNAAGSLSKIAAGFGNAAFSPDGKKIAVSLFTSNTVTIISRGGVMRQVPGNGAGSVAWSPNGRYLAYPRLVPGPCKSGDSVIMDSDLCADGIALFDTVTGEVTKLTNNGGDSSVLRFSRDGKRVYFRGGRNYPEWPEARVNSTWMVDIATKQETPLQNKSAAAYKTGAYEPAIGDNALWAADESFVVSDFVQGENKSTWLSTLSLDGRIIKSEQIAEGYSPQWVVRDKVVAVRVKGAQGSQWQVISIR